MVAPTRVTSYASALNTTTTPKTSTSFDVVAGDLITLIALDGGPTGVINTPTATGGSITWTLQQDIAATGYGDCRLWTGTVGATATGITISQTTTSGLNWGFRFSVWRDHGGVGVTAKANTTGAPAVTMAGLSDNSAVSFGSADFNAQSGAITYRAINGVTFTADASVQVAGDYSGYFGYILDIGTAPGTGVAGTTAPTGQKFSIVAVEVLGIATVAYTGSISLSGAGTLTRTATTPSLTASRALSGTGTLSLSGKPAFSRPLALSGAGNNVEVNKVDQVLVGYIAPLTSQAQEDGYDSAEAFTPPQTQHSYWGYAVNSTANGVVKMATTITEEIARSIALQNAGNLAIPSITNHRDGVWNNDQETMLADPVKRASFVTSAVNLAVTNGFAGVDLDFEDTVNTYRTQQSSLAQDLSVALHNVGKRLAVTVFPKQDDAGYNTVDRNGSQDYAALGAAADWMRIMAYDWNWSTAPTAGATAPIGWVQSVMDYAVTQVAAYKLVLGCAVWGYDWPISAGGTNHGTTTGGADVRTYAEVQALISTYGVTPTWDDTDKSYWFRYTVGGQLREVWYEDARSIAEKAKIARTMGLGGLMFWRLGNEDPAIWATVAAPAVTASGTRAFSGTGALTTTRTVGVSGTRALSGAGTLSFSNIFVGVALTLSGSGTLSRVASAPSMAQSRALTGSGTLSISKTGMTVTGATADLGGVGTLSFAPVAGASGSRALSGAGTQTRVGKPGFADARTLGSDGTLDEIASAPGFVQNLALSGPGDLNPVLTDLDFAASRALSGTGTLSRAAVAGYSTTRAGSGAGTVALSNGKPGLIVPFGLTGAGTNIPTKAFVPQRVGFYTSVYSRVGSPPDPTRTISGISVQAGDLIVVSASANFAYNASDTDGVTFGLPTSNMSGPPVWTSRVRSLNTVSQYSGMVETFTAQATATQTSRTITITPTDFGYLDQGSNWGFNVSVWRGHGGVGNVDSSFGQLNSVPTDSFAISDAMAGIVVTAATYYPFPVGEPSAYATVNGNPALVENVQNGDASSMGIASWRYAMAGPTGNRTIGMTVSNGGAWGMTILEILSTRDGRQDGSGVGDLDIVQKGVSQSKTFGLTGNGTLSFVTAPDFDRTLALSGSGLIDETEIPRLVQTKALTGTGTQTRTGAGISVDGDVNPTGVGNLTASFVVPGMGGPTSLSGTGTLTVMGAVAKVGPLALSGAGTLTRVATNVTQSTSLTLSGVGNETRLGKPAFTDAMDFDGAGALTFSPVTGLSGATSLSGSGALGIVPLPRFTGTLTLSGAGTLTRAVVPGAVAAPALAGNGTLTMAGKPGASGAVSRTGNGQLSLSTIGAAQDTRELGGEGTLIASGKPGALGDTDLTGSGALSVAGKPSPAVTAALSGSGDLSFDTIVFKTVPLTGNGLLGFDRTVNLSGSKTLTGHGTLSVAPKVASETSATFSAEGFIDLSGKPTPKQTLGLTGDGALGLDVEICITGDSHLGGIGTLTIEGTPAVSGAVGTDGTGTIQIITLPRFAALASLGGSGLLKLSLPMPLTGDGDLDLSGRPGVFRTRALTGSGKLSMAGRPGMLSTGISRTGSGQLVVRGELANPLELSGEGGLSFATKYTFLGNVDLTGSGVLTAVATPAGRPVGKVNDSLWFGRLRGNDWRSAISDITYLGRLK